MKRNLLAILSLITINANALIVSVNGHGEIDEKGLELTINETETDPYTGEQQMQLKGNLVCSTPLTVTITRSSAGLVDEFCCDDQCTFGNGQITENLQFTPDGSAKWYTHYTPAPNSHVTVVYTFTADNQSLTLTVHYNNDAEGVEELTDEGLQVTGRKVLKDGILYIEKNNKTYTIL